MQRAHGYSLVEVLSALSVAAVMVSVAVPSARALVASTRVSTAASDLLADLLLTRSEAIKRKRRVVMCKSADGDTCAVAGGWQQGWIVFVDADADGKRAPGEAVLRTQPALAAELRLTGTLPVAKYVSYAPNGGTKLVGGGFQAGTLTLCSAAGGPARQVVLNATGRPRTQKVLLPSCS